MKIMMLWQSWSDVMAAVHGMIALGEKAGEEGRRERAGKGKG